jgi:hypothetical protein
MCPMVSSGRSWIVLGGGGDSEVMSREVLVDCQRESHQSTPTMIPSHCLRSSVSLHPLPVSSQHSLAPGPSALP